MRILHIMLNNVTSHLFCAHRTLYTCRGNQQHYFCIIIYTLGNFLLPVYFIYFLVQRWPSHLGSLLKKASIQFQQQTIDRLSLESNSSSSLLHIIESERSIFYLSKYGGQRHLLKLKPYKRVKTCFQAKQLHV